jgi:hypothetical protein
VAPREISRFDHCWCEALHGVSQRGGPLVAPGVRNAREFLLACAVPAPTWAVLSATIPRFGQQLLEFLLLFRESSPRMRILTR